MPQTVLLVDDSSTVRKAAEMVSAKGGFTLVTAADEAQALVQAQELMPSLLLVDCGMRDRSGYDLVRDLREDAQVGHIPVMMLSGAQNPYDEEAGRNVGAVGHLLKPFDTETFVACVNELLSQVTPKGHMDSVLPAEGQIDSIPPSTLPSPSQEMKAAGSEAIEAAAVVQEPSHFEINMEESIPPTPVRREQESVIQEVGDAEIISEAEEESQSAEASEPTESAEEVIEDAEIIQESALPTEEVVAAAEDETESAPSTTKSTNGEMAHSDLLQAALTRIPEEELRSLVRATVESVVWEVVPELAESLIKAEIQRILSDKTGG